MKRIIFSVIACGLIIMISLFTLVNAGCSTGLIKNYKPADVSSRVRSPLVVSYHEAAKKAGYIILNSGGNAFDAFVAVTMVENVVSSGYVTLAGLLSTLIYRAGTDEILYLDGGYNSVLDPEGAYDPKNPVIGKAIVVPGIVAGLEAISTRFGRLSFANVLQPAIEIASDGFVIDKRYAGHIQAEARKLRGTEYGRRTFFPNGTALQAGNILKQPELAEFLAKLAEQGAGYMYRGEWAARCVETVRRQGGVMTRPGHGILSADLDAALEDVLSRLWHLCLVGPHNVCPLGASRPENPGAQQYQTAGTFFRFRGRTGNRCPCGTGHRQGVLDQGLSQPGQPGPGKFQADVEVYGGHLG